MWSTEGWSSAHLWCRNCCPASCKGALAQFLSHSVLWGDLHVPSNEPSGHMWVSHGDWPLTQQPQLKSCSDPPPRNKALFSLLLVMPPMLEDNREHEQQKTTGTNSLETVGCVRSTWASGTPLLPSWTQESWKTRGRAVQKYPHLQYVGIPLPQPQRKLCRDLPYWPSACSTRGFPTSAASSSSTQQVC